MRKRRIFETPWHCVALVVCGLMLSSCAETQFLAQTAKSIGGKADKTTTGVYKVGKPYQVEGAWYYPAVDYNYDETGIASWYGPNFHGKFTANGERYDMNALTAAHRTLPMPSFVRVTNLENGRSVVLKVNDRGPFARGRIIDVSRRAAQLLGFENKGTARVNVAILPDESRAIAAKLQGGVRLAAADTPLTVDRLPTTSVNSESLPPPPGAKVAAEQPPQELPGAQLRSTTAREEAPVETAALPNPTTETVKTVAVSPSQIFVQAGAYSVFDNANRVRARLAGVGKNVDISSVLINNRDIYRVRVGPITSVEDADAILELVVRAGYNDARIVVVQ